MPRPKSPDPATQKAVYPRRSFWDRITKRAEEDRVKPGELFVTLAEEGLNARDAKLIGEGIDRV